MRTPTATVGGPFVTRTPAPAQACPPGDERATISFPQDLYTPEVEQRLLDFLNAGGTASELEMALEILAQAESLYGTRSETIDLTGDGVVELVVHGLGSGLLIFGCQTGRYATLFVLPPFLGAISLASFFDEFADMNANGVPEVAWFWSDYGANDATNYFSIEEWDGTQFVSLIESRLAGPQFAVMFNGYPRVRDTDANGTLELILQGGVDEGLSACGFVQRVRTDTWMWNGERFVLDRYEYEAPVFRYQAVADGDAAFLEYAFEEALAHYQTAIFDVDLQLSNWFPPQPEYCGMEGGFYLEVEELDLVAERAQLEAFSRYRILQLHAAQQTTDAAQVVYGELQTRFPTGAPGHEYAELAEVFWGEFQSTQSVSSACTAVLAFAAPRQDEILKQLEQVLWESLWVPSIYTEEQIRPVYLCPFR
jgi:hypothetical protein